jgi:hypothetical protein
MNVDKNEITITEEESKICKLDGKKFNSSREMINYVKKTYEDINSYEDYVIKAYYDGIRPVCLKTGKSLTFKSHKLGPWFKNYTKNAFPRKKHSEETKQKIKKGCEKTSMEKYGVKNVFSADWCREKIKNTNLEKYGVENVMQCDEIKNKFDFVKTEESLQKTRKTNLERYGSESLFGSGYFKQKTKETVLEKYGVDNVMKDPEISKRHAEKTSKTMIKVFSLMKTNRSNTKPEREFKQILTENNVNYTHQKPTEHGCVDFYLHDTDQHVEIDGTYWHPKKCINLNFPLLKNKLHDKLKDKNIPNLIRIREEDICKIKCVNDITNNTYNYDYKLSYHDIIIQKEYFEYYSVKHGNDKLESKVNLLHKFIKEFQPSFPEISTAELLPDVINKISKYDTSVILENDTFRNNCSTIGNSYLKSKFHSYWKTKFKKNKYSPVEAWQDDDMMKRIIKYRIGCNNTGEIFDFSLHQLIRGMSAIRLTASFFKPMLAAAIYDHLLFNKNDPTVIDPCCGFGGRLLGFKSKFPNGKYIGCEPNIETYNELIQLISDAKLHNVEIHNCRWEDFNVPAKYDLIFTSIPYFDLEIYSNPTNYSNFESWENTFIKKFKHLNNCYINMDIDVCNKLDLHHSVKYKLHNGKSHFSKFDSKYEVIVKM